MFYLFLFAAEFSAHLGSYFFRLKFSGSLKDGNLKNIPTFHCWRNFGAMVSCSLLILYNDYHPAQLEPGEHETQKPVRDSDFCGASFFAPEVDMSFNVSKQVILQVEDVKLSKNATFSASPAHWTSLSRSHFIHVLILFLYYFCIIYSWSSWLLASFGMVSVADDLDLLISCPFRSLRLVYVILLFCFGRLESATWAAAIAVHCGTAFYILLHRPSLRNLSSLFYALQIAVLKDWIKYLRSDANRRLIVANTWLSILMQESLG